MYVDAMASFWREWIVNYDVVHQQALAVSAGSRSRYWFSVLRRWWHRHYEVLMAAARRSGSAVAGSPLALGPGRSADRPLCFSLLSSCRGSCWPWKNSDWRHGRSGRLAGQPRCGTSA